MKRHHEYDQTPVASYMLELDALSQQIAALRRSQIEEEIKSLALQTRINNRLGELSDLMQHLELQAGKKKAAPVSPEAA